MISGLSEPLSNEMIYRLVFVRGLSLPTNVSCENKETQAIMHEIADAEARIRDLRTKLLVTIETPELKEKYSPFRPDEE